MQMQHRSHTIFPATENAGTVYIAVQQQQEIAQEIGKDAPGA
jgi:hypothetical protein